MGQGTRIVNMVYCTYSIGKITPEFLIRGKRGSFWRIPVYSNTKLAVWLFTRELSERLKTEGITVNAADPGIGSTNIIRMDMWFDPLTDIPVSYTHLDVYKRQSLTSSFAKKLGVFNLIKFITTSLSVVKYSLITIELSCVIELSFEIYW